MARLNTSGITDATTSIKGKLKLAGDFSGTATSPTVKSRAAIITIGPLGTTADYVCTGTHDGVTIQSAFTALLSTGGKILIRNGTYNFDSVADKMFCLDSNIVIEGETYGGVIFQATADFADDGNPRHGMLSIGNTNSSPVSNVTVRNIIFDCNNKKIVTGLTLDGGRHVGTTIGLQNVILENITIKGFSPDHKASGMEGAMCVISGQTGTFGSNTGFVDNVTINRLDTSGGWDGVFIYGGNLTRFSWNNCYIHDNYKNGIEYNGQSQVGTSSDWEFRSCRFLNNMSSATPTSSSLSDYRDSDQTGVDNLTFDKCYFGPVNNVTSVQAYALSPYVGVNTKIVGNIFDRSYAALSTGYSISGSYASIAPNQRLLFEDNIMYQNVVAGDFDADITAIFRGNIYYEQKKNSAFFFYSRHFPTVFENNLIYNCNAADTSVVTSNQRAAIQSGADGIIIRNNYVIDDRIINNPVTITSLSQVAGGAIGATTYYVRATWQNDQEQETLPSTEQNLAVSASNLLKVSRSISFVPSGARYLNIYVGTSSGSETLQTQIPLPATSAQAVWTLPTSGLVSGSAMPVSNTTATMTKYGIYEGAGGASGTFASIYHNNTFIGINQPIRKDSSYAHISYGNYSLGNQGNSLVQNVETAPYALGNISGSTTLDLLNSETLTMTLTGNTTFTFPSGNYIGQVLRLIISQDGTGSRVATWPGNFKKAGGTLTLSTAVSSIDNIASQWDGTNWNEVSRALNVS